MGLKIAVLIIFLLTYVFIIALPKYKLPITAASSILSAAILLIAGKMDFIELLGGIDYNVILMLLGIMLTVGLFADSEMPAALSDKIISKVPSTLVAIVLLSVLSGVVSAFLDNVATVLMLAPIGISVAKKTGVSPVPVIISIAVSSNLQGAATLVGDTTSVMLGSFANMSFFDFFFLDGKFSIFWAVELGALLTIPVIMFIFRKHNARLNYTPEKIVVKTVVPTVLLLINLLLLIVFSFVTNKLAITNGLICAIIGVIAVAYDSLKFRHNPLVTVKKSVDYESVLFLICLFILIVSVEKVGLIDDIASLFISIGNKNVFLLYTVIVVGSVVCSAFIDNIPFVATMLPVISGLAAGLPDVSPYLLYFGLLCGATLGGNLTPIGASANIVGIGILKKEGYSVKTSDFLKIGVPFTLLAVFGGYIFCWLVWGI